MLTGGGFPPKNVEAFLCFPSKGWSVFVHYTRPSHSFLYTASDQKLDSEKAAGLESYLQLIRNSPLR